MLSLWHEPVAWLQAVLAGMADPWVIAVVLALTTLLVEDLAIAAGVALAAQGMISWELSFAAVAGGIAVGDLGLYGLGYLARRVHWIRRRYVGERSRWVRDRLVSQLAGAVLLARVIPGLRLVTYTASGFVLAPLVPFTGWVLVAVTIWTAGLYGTSVAIGQALSARLGVPLPVAVALPAVALAVLAPLVRHFRSRISRDTP